MNKEDLKEKTGIYLEPQMDTIPEYYDRDIIKVLTKNPIEVFIFWGVSQHSFKRIKDFFQVDLESVHYKLFIRYTDEDKHSHFNEIHLSAFTTSYVLKFPFPVKNLRVEIIAFNNNGGVYSLMHSAYLSMPTNKTSSVLHHEWIHPMWTQGAYVEQVDGKYYLKESGKELDPSENNPIWESTILYDGSSGFSSHAIPSSSFFKKKD
ncbi:MAG: DUF4912 domain-containing protein [Leptospiraceae bacterium]|nr:DUF4912 domain-containing protein [Leptospiraceae bacterium]